MPFEIVYTVRDSGNNTSTSSVKIPETFALADYIEFGQDFMVLAGAIMRGQVLSAELCLDVDVSALTSNTVSALSDVQEIGAFEFVTAEGNRVKLNIPGCPDIKTIAGTNTLDPTDPQVATIITMMEDGLTGVQPCDIGGDDIVEMLFAREHRRSSGRRQA